VEEEEDLEIGVYYDSDEAAESTREHVPAHGLVDFIDLEDDI
jgi:hypothetical protein